MKTNVFVTSDIALAAYLKLKGLVLTECEKGTKFKFVFDDPNFYAEELAINFANSEIRKYDDEVRSLKKIIYNKKK